MELGLRHRARARASAAIGGTMAIEHDGAPALLKQTDYLQRMQLRAAGLLAYPFNRGLRVELSGGVRHAMYHRELRSQISSSATGRVLASESVTPPGGVPTTVAEVGAALVHDTTVFGATGPAARIALSVRDRSRDWRSVLHAHRRRLPEICDAGAAVLDRRPGAALGAVWSRWRRPAAAVQFSRVELLRARPSTGSAQLPAGPDARVRRRAAWQPAARQQPRGAVSDLGNVLARARLRTAAGRCVRVHRWRHGVVGLASLRPASGASAAEFD